MKSKLLSCNALLILTYVIFTQCVYTEETEKFQSPFPNCKFNEVVFVLDVSETITSQVFNELKQFTNRIISKIQIFPTPYSSRFGAVVFADTARKVIHCDQYTTTQNAKAAIMNLKRGKGVLTNMQAGILKGGEVLNERGCGQRKNKPYQQIMILISDGRANIGAGGRSGVISTAKQIREEQGVLILAIGVGHNIDKELLLEIVNKNEELYVSTGETLDNVFDSTMLMIRKDLCFDKISTQKRECECMLNEDITQKTINGTSITFNDDYIIKHYKGSCFLEKVLKALADVDRQIKWLQESKSRNLACLEQKQHSIKNMDHKYLNEFRFSGYDSCLKVKCYIQSLERSFSFRKMFLEHACDEHPSCLIDN